MVIFIAELRVWMAKPLQLQMPTGGLFDRSISITGKYNSINNRSD